MKLNNRRLPQKNTKSFSNGKPLCFYILNTLQKLEDIDEVYVYCSNAEIQKYIPKEVKFLQRSSNLDKDTTSMNEILLSFAQTVDSDIYLLAHTTAPFIKPESIRRGLNAIKVEGYDSAVAVKKLQDFIWKNNKPFNYDLTNIPRTQDLEPLFIETCGFYAFTKNVICSLNRRIGDNPYMVEVSEIESIDIDEQEDFIIADSIFNHYFKGIIK